MTFVYRELDAEETERVEALGIKSPWCKGPAVLGKPAVDSERDAIVVGLGGGSFEIPCFWALIIDSSVAILEGQRIPSKDRSVDRRLTVQIDRRSPVDSPIWQVPEVYRLLKEGLFMVIADGEAYYPGAIRFAGNIGELVEDA
ncbi:MAG: hypothetical protein LBK95_01795 [Bifidobacteriaceae bacterium]|nr:hypothetical protein [Bifidobacteriaceae bacterium]